MGCSPILLYSLLLLRLAGRGFFLVQKSIGCWIMLIFSWQSCLVSVFLLQEGDLILNLCKQGSCFPSCEACMYSLLDSFLYPKNQSRSSQQ